MLQKLALFVLETVVADAGMGTFTIYARSAKGWGQSLLPNPQKNAPFVTGVEVARAEMVTTMMPARSVKALAGLMFTNWSLQKNKSLNNKQDNKFSENGVLSVHNSLNTPFSCTFTSNCVNPK